MIPRHPFSFPASIRRSRNPATSTSKTGSSLLSTLLVEAAHSLAKRDSGPLGQSYARKAQEIGLRKVIIAPARKLLIVARCMLLTGEVSRAAKATAVARKQREVHAEGPGFRCRQ